jgi:hypothetical protein
VKVKVFSGSSLAQEYLKVAPRTGRGKIAPACQQVYLAVQRHEDVILRHLENNGDLRTLKVDGIGPRAKSILYSIAVEQPKATG